MKKLLILATAVCMAVASHAAKANWDASANNIFNGTGASTTAAKYTGTAYIFDSGVISQSDLYSVIAAGTTTFSSSSEGKVGEGFAGSGSVSKGLLSTSEAFSYGTQSASESNVNKYNFYFVLIDSANEQAYFSTVVEASANATATTKSITFGSQRTGSIAAPTKDGFAGAGAWSSVPEPTSGLLLLLGFAGLALRRKQK